MEIRTHENTDGRFQFYIYHQNKLIQSGSDDYNTREQAEEFGARWIDAKYGFAAAQAARDRISRRKNHGSRIEVRHVIVNL